MVIFIVALVGGVPFLIWYLNKRGRWLYEAASLLDHWGIPKPERKWRFDYTTPKGAKIKSTVEVPASAQTAVDEGIQRCIDRFHRAFPNWDKYQKVSDYDVFFVEPRGVSEVDLPGAPVFEIGGWRAAAATLGCDDHWLQMDKRPIIVAPHQKNQNWSFLPYLSDAVHNEAEHVLGWVHRTYEPTNIFYNFIGANDVHPWPIDAPPTALGLIAELPPQKQNCLGVTK